MAGALGARFTLVLVGLACLAAGLVGLLRRRTRAAAAEVVVPVQADVIRKVA